MTASRRAGLFWSVACVLLIAGAASGPATWPLRPDLLMELRVPRVLLAFAAGALLSTCGAWYQTLLRNPLADPYILGISGAAALGASLPAVFGPGIGLGMEAAALGALAGGAVMLLLLMTLRKVLRAGSSAALLLTGMAANLMCAVLVQLLLARSADPWRRQAFGQWLLGTLPEGDQPWLRIAALAACALALVLFGMRRARLLDAWLLPEPEQEAIGALDAKRRFRMLIAVTSAAALAVALAGAIGFIGLLVPHAARAAVGSSHRRLFTAAAMGGGALLVGSDGLVRSGALGPMIPVGAITALLGAPLFIALLWRQGRNP